MARLLDRHVADFGEAGDKSAAGTKPTSGSAATSGARCATRPDFIVKPKNGTNARDRGQGAEGREGRREVNGGEALDAAVNAWGKLGQWSHCMCFKASQAITVLDEAGSE